MAEYTGTVHVHASADQVFNFVSQLGRLQAVMPGVEKIEETGPGTFRATQTINGQQVQGNYRYQIEPEPKRVKWESTEGGAHGYLHVVAEGNHAALTMHLNSQRRDEHSVTQQVTQTLNNIKHRIESGQGS